MFKVQGSRFKVLCSRFIGKAHFKYSSRFKVQGSWIEFQGSGLKVKGSRFKVHR